MNENVNSKNEEISKKDNPDVVAVLKKMQGQLDSIEGKINSLMHQSKQKTVKDKYSSAPRKEYDKTKHSKDRKHKGKKEEVSSEGKFYHGHPFGKKKDSGKSDFKKNKKSFKKPSKEG